MTSPRYALSLLVSLFVCVAMMGQPASDPPSAADAKTAPPEPPAIALTIEHPAAPERPVALMPLYASFAALQALDIHSTLRAPEFGGREMNPIVGGMLGSPATFVAVKAGMTAAVYYGSERLWKRHKAAAIVMMMGLNGAYATIVAHNYAVERRPGN